MKFFNFFFFLALEFLNFKLQEDGRTLHTQLDGKKIYNIISYGEKEYVVSVNLSHIICNLTLLLHLQQP